MAAILEKLRTADFTGLNRAFGRGKHSPKIPPPPTHHPRGISGGPNQAQSFTKIRPAGSGSILDDDDISPVQVIIRSSTVFFVLIDLFIYMAIASFQKKWNVGPSGLTGLSLFVLSQAFLHALAFLIVPQIYERTDILKGFARAIRLTRVQFIVYGTQTSLSLILSLVTTISAYTGGCKNSSLDPNAELKDYISNINGFCRNKRAAAAFWWFIFLSFGISCSLVTKSWYMTRKKGPSHPTFEPPRTIDPQNQDEEDEDEEEGEGLQEERSRNEMSSVVRPSYYGERGVFENENVPAGYSSKHLPYGVQPITTGLNHQQQQHHQLNIPQPMTAYKDPFDEIRAQIYSTHNQ